MIVFSILPEKAYEQQETPCSAYHEYIYSITTKVLPTYVTDNMLLRRANRFLLPDYLINIAVFEDDLL